MLQGNFYVLNLMLMILVQNFIHIFGVSCLYLSFIVITLMHLYLDLLFGKREPMFTKLGFGSPISQIPSGGCKTLLKCVKSHDSYCNLLVYLP